MTIRRLLIVPADALVEREPAHPAAALVSRALKSAKRRIFGMPSVYNSEIQRYGDIPAILGQENTFILGRTYPHLHIAPPPPACPYPSCHATPAGTIITERQLEPILPNVDAVLVSVQAGARGALARASARRRGIPVAILDASDHQSIYKARNISAELTCGLEAGPDFDLYFKENLPLGYQTEIVLPLAPAPLRPEVYQFRALPKAVDIFYSGKMRGHGQPDGTAVIELIRQNFPAAELVDHKTHGTFLTLRDYWDGLSAARLALSPSRFDWDSFRHCESALAPGTALIAPKPYVETIGPPLMDGVNAVLYDTEFRDGWFYLKKAQDLVDKIRHYLAHPAEREAMADRWAADVLAGHTVRARSQYILDRMTGII
ncbi:MAG: glycosyltransferase family 1 protein [Candidatus Sungbacteria bacterium]|uniref:Glycosyltransferase family 1 protein n=1 Tax=Candidatus Sungiibacteriota bacterium TaxID=2750080 RepID=A0A932YY03_9BACT|nr:glycosyltransferase family 1 protein [Candidatus Sungbacteria bacterium]